MIATPLAAAPTRHGKAVRSRFHAVPRLVRVCAFIGAVVAIPVAALGVFAGELVGIAGGYVGGDDGFSAGVGSGFAFRELPYSAGRGVVHKSENGSVVLRADLIRELNPTGSGVR